ncbi:hypothetical protein L3X38_026819 [Prunus dulcis]|uniref:Uncharacterized protein n=1 Tax=Prunus dulcis TaxID=3755 RepID=A0AAD4VLW3_PRUDU|nr:hypothetical protein L3X38_026819 [Prunus dulcis]
MTSSLHPIPSPPPATAAAAAGKYQKVVCFDPKLLTFVPAIPATKYVDLTPPLAPVEAPVVISGHADDTSLIQSHAPLIS